MLNIADKAMNFDLKDSEDKNVKLSDYLGKKVILYFYPKNYTPGCTIEARNFSKNIDKFNSFNTIVFGISSDSVSSHKGFKDLCGLSINTLSDEKLVVSKEYEVLKENGKSVERSTYLIDEIGNIQFIWRNVNPLTHTNQILKYLENKNDKNN